MARGEFEAFEYQLARELGMTVTRMRAEMPEREYREWAALMKLEGERALHRSRLRRR
jgi:hypothetical protein